MALELEKPRVLIVGGGFGGLQAAKALGKAPVQVSLIDRNNYHLFQPLLYQVATAGLSPGDIAEPIRKIVKRQKNTEVLLAEVQTIELEKRKLILRDRELGYDYLILAPGSGYNYFGHPAWAKIAPELKTLGNALEIRQKILLAFERAEMEEDPVRRRALMTFVVVGGGPTGVELAGAIAELAHKALAWEFRRADIRETRIILAEAGGRILSSFPEHLAGEALSELKKLRVEVRLNAPVQEVSDEGAKIAGEWVAAKTVLWAAGVLASPLIQKLACDVDRLGRAVVREDLSLPDHPEVFVIGDAAAVEHEGKPLPGIAPVAIQEGRYVGRRIAARAEGKIDFPPFHYLDKGQMATVGRNFAIVDIGKLKFGGFFAWLIWAFVHILFLIGMENKILVFLQWAWYYFTYQRGPRLITADPSRLSE